MARIPTYEPQVAPREAGGAGYLHLRADPDAFGAGIGEAATRFGVTAQHAALEVVRTIDHAKISKSLMAFQTDVNTKQNTDWNNRLNDNVQGLPQEAEEYIGEARKKYTEGLNPRQLERFDSATFGFVQGTNDSVARHTRQQGYNFAKALAEQTQVQAGDMAAGSFTDPTLLAASEKQNEEGIANYVRLNQLSGATAEQYAAESRQKFNLAVVTGAINADKLQWASDYLADPKHALAPLYHGRVLATLETGLRQERVQLLADEYMKEAESSGPKAMELLEKDKSVKDARTRADTYAELVRRTEVQNKIRQENDRAAEGVYLKWVAEDPVNNTPGRATTTQLLQMGFGFDRILAFQKMQASDGPKDIEQAIQMNHAFTDQLTKWRPEGDPKGTEAQALFDDAARLHKADPTLGTKAFAALEEKRNPDSRLPADVNNFMLFRGPNSTPGGAQGYLLEAVKKANEDLNPWFGPPPLVGETVEVGTPAQKIGYPQEVYDYARYLYGKVKAAAIKHGKEWTAEDVDEYMRNDGEIQGQLVEGVMKDWKKKLGTNPVPPLPAFTPDAVMAK